MSVTVSNPAAIPAADTNPSSSPLPVEPSAAIVADALKALAPSLAAFVEALSTVQYAQSIAQTKDDIQPCPPPDGWMTESVRLRLKHMLHICQCSRPKLNQMIKEGKVPAPKNDGRPYWPSLEVAAYESAADTNA